MNAYGSPRLVGATTETGRMLVSVSAAVLLTAIFSGPTNAQQRSAAAVGSPATKVGEVSVGEVIVTAQKRAENVQEVPMSITAVGKDFLKKTGVADLTELANFVPSFNINTSNTSRNTSVMIRGIGSSGTNPGIEPDVGVFIDNVYQPQAGMVAGDLLDINSVEILRGPQGTLYGRNTPVGAVNITTTKPSQAFQGGFRAGIGDYDLRYVSGYLNGGLTPDLAARVSFWDRDRSGYEKDPTLGHAVDDYDGYGLRARLLYTPTDVVSVNLIAHYDNIHENCCVAEQINASGPYGIATPGFLAAQTALGFPFQNLKDHDHVVYGADEGSDSSRMYGVSAQIDWKVGGLTLSSITAYDRWNDLTSVSSAALPQLVYISPQSNISDTLSEELRVASPAGHFFEFLGGVYLYAQNLNYEETDIIGPGADRVFPGAVCKGVSPCKLKAGDSGQTQFSQHTRSAAVYGSGTLHPTSKWSITGGLRYSVDDKKDVINDPNAVGDSAAYNSAQPQNLIGAVTHDESHPTWSVDTRYEFTRDLMAYATVATGYKSGGFNSRRVPPGTPVEFQAETSINYEGGVKSEFFDHRVVLDADVFLMRLDGFQDSLLNPVTGTGFIVGNAGNREVKGVEASFDSHPIRELTLSANIAYLDSRFTNYTDAQCAVNLVPNGSKPGTCNYTGRTPALSPDWKASASAQWTQPLGIRDLDWFVRGEANYNGSMNLSPTLDIDTLQRSYTLVNLRAGIQSSNWTIAAWVKNVGDTAYYAVAASQPVGAFVSGGGTAAARGFVGWYGPPRTYGLELTAHF
jgi:iron complex outermembrane receptor protein